MTPDTIHGISIAVAAGLGAILLAILAWTNSNEAFNWRKFIGSAVTAVIAGITVAATYNYTNVFNIVTVLTAVLTGMGADASRKAISNISRQPGTPIASTTTSTTTSITTPDKPAVAPDKGAVWKP